ncbi:MAG: formylglycine-generating enzyme family protein [Anderseniella sp.]|nr:formylglycine-generating enzyme family protein [Anderseniella sp.]
MIASSRLSGLLCVAAICTSTPALADMQRVGSFEIDRTEVTIGQFRQFVEATGTVTAAGKAGGGQVYGAGWEQKRGWTWSAPYGEPGADEEPAAYVTYDEAKAYCAWAGKRLPTDAEWMEAAYTERRADPPAGFETGKTYDYPTGETPQGANCLDGCGPTPEVDRSAVLDRGRGHAAAGTTKPGVNGLYDMGANLWEWVDGTNGAGQVLTRGGSWWYGPAQMHREHIQSKPPETAVVYIGFRCARDAGS